MNENSAITFLGIYFLGLGLNLTPCVYPLMSVTISLFAGPRNVQEPVGFKSFFRALVYVLGLVVTNTSLAVLAAFTGGVFGSLLQNQWVLLAISLFIFLLALSTFGVYTFQAPGWLMQKLSSRKAVGWLGLFVSGMIVGIFAAPCIGPPVIALLTWVGSIGNLAFAVFVFLILSLGLGTPYLILGTFSGLLKKLPKSGVWLVWVERLFGIILLVLSAFYALLALAPEHLSWLFPAGLILGGIYLGFISHQIVYPPRFNDFRKAFGILMVIAGILIPMSRPQESVIWEPYSSEKIAQAKAEGKPVIIDFYADWCIPCHELDRMTYTNPQVIKALEPFVRLKADLTSDELPYYEELTEKYELEGVPTIVFIDPKGEEIVSSRLAGFYAPQEFLKIMQELPFWKDLQS